MARSQQRDFYEVLGVTKTASVEEIKSAYRKVGPQWHPDRNPDNKEEAEIRFRECTEAYSVLSDAQKRQIYDTYGHAGLAGASGQSDFNDSIFQDFHDIFGDFLRLRGSLWRRPGAQRAVRACPARRRSSL